MNGIVLMVFQREMCKRSHPSLVPWVVCDPEVAMLGLGGGSLPRHQLLRMENEGSFGTGRETEWALKRLEYQYHPNLSHKQLCNCTKWTAFSLPIKWRRDKVSPSSVSFGLSLFLLSLTACGKLVFLLTVCCFLMLLLVSTLNHHYTSFPSPF